MSGVRHASLNSRAGRSNPNSVTVGGVPKSSASSMWDLLFELVVIAQMHWYSGAVVMS